MTTVHLVSHTHWDREWYHPAVRFRQRLVALVDELLSAPPSAGSSFLLDGQTVVTDDYLEIRPERAGELSALLSSGSLEAGPWFVLSDELIPGGEALVRNLLAGARSLRALRAHAPPVLYCPDSFGHPAALPALAHGFGFGTVVLWRGYGGARFPAADAAWWHAPGGERVLLWHLSRSGYELGANLPADAVKAWERWAAIRTELLGRNALGVTLLLNGADHHARQARLAEAATALAAAARPDEVRASSLGAFVADLTSRARNHDLPAVSGELRDSYGFSWTLQGTFATRAAQKRRNAQLERALVRDTEPWIAIAARAGAASRHQLVHAAWRSLLLCHPHDTLCGCSTDEVARGMDARMDDAEAQAAGLRDDAIADIVGHHPDAARERRAEWTPVALVRNPAARPRQGVALLDLTTFLADVRVGAAPDAIEPLPASRATPALAGVAAVQPLARAVKHERTESPRHYPDDDLVAVSHVAAWVPEIPGYGVRAFRQQAKGTKQPIPNPAHADGNAIGNGRIALRVHDGGRVEFHDEQRGSSLDDLLTWESLIDAGDLYTPSPRGVKFAAAFGGCRVTHRGPVRAALEARWAFRAGRERVDVRVHFIVDADAPWLRLHIEGTNAAMDHRLRLRCATGIPGGRVFADAMFGAVERRLLAIPAAEMRTEQVLATAPLHRYVSVFGDGRGATLYSDGLAEYEATPAGELLVTLLRSVGELSRQDLPERPGHAGWPTPTPGAQCPGAFTAELAFMLHGERSISVIDQVERAADDILLPLVGNTLRPALRLAPPAAGVVLLGEGLAFGSVKQADDGAWTVLRCVNLLDEPCSGSWDLETDVTDARLARLDETPIARLQATGARVPFTAGPRAVVTILVR
jgi:alpha-mannosidase